MTDPLRVQLARVNLAILNAEAWARRYPGSNPSGYIADLIAERAAIEVSHREPPDRRRLRDRAARLVAEGRLSSRNMTSESRATA